MNQISADTKRLMELLADIVVAEEKICIDYNTDRRQEHLDAIYHHVNCIARTIEPLGAMYLVKAIAKRTRPDE